MNTPVWLAVFVGGGVGSMARFGVSQLFLRNVNTGALPWATISANLLATALMALLMLRVLDGSESAAARAFWLVGLCGGFSTFSTFSAENYELLQRGMLIPVMANVVISLVACVLVFHLFAQRS